MQDGRMSTVPGISPLTELNMGRDRAPRAAPSWRDSPFWHAGNGENLRLESLVDWRHPLSAMARTSEITICVTADGRSSAGIDPK